MTAHRCFPVGSTLLLGLVLALACAPRRAAAQDPVITASLLKRLASAVDGYRTGRPVWVVASVQFPNEVGGVFSSVDAADSAAFQFGVPYRKFGPFIAPPDSGLMTIVYYLACKGKRLDTSCPPIRDSVPMDTVGIRPTSIDNVLSVTLTVRTKDGRSMSTTVPPEHAEAFFLTMSAVDKFLMPYYTQLFGAEYAAYLRQEYLRQFIRRPGH